MKLSPSTPIVVFGDDWGRHVSSMQHVFRPLVCRNPVVWVNAIGHRVPRLASADLRRAWEKGKALLGWQNSTNRSSGARPRVVVEPRVLPWHYLSSVHTFNTWSLVRAIRKALAGIGTAEAPVLVTGSPPSVGVVGRIGEVASVYFCMDDFLHLPGVSARMLGSLEQRLLARVDGVVATAEKLTHTKRPRSGRSFYLPQGVNFQHFATPRPEPDDIRTAPRPRIGFAGGVSECVSLPVLRQLSQAFPEGSIVLVGPVSVDLAALRCPNIHVLGPRPYNELPAYVQSFDVGIIPYLRSPWTEAVDPLKLLEYLAAGIPVVTTVLPEVQKYAAAVKIADEGAEFVQAVRECLGVDRTRARAMGQELAAQHTWELRANRLIDILGELVELRRGAHAEP
jgi:glycosyltransferase involved in cell wall biosynthesis